LLILPAQYGVKAATKMLSQKISTSKIKMGNQTLILTPHKHRKFIFDFGADAGT